METLIAYQLLRHHLLMKQSDSQHLSGLMARDLLLVIAWHAFKGAPMTVKQCILNTNGAEKTVRRNLQLLIRLGYLTFKRNERDGRERLLIPTYGFMARLSTLDSMLAGAIENAESDNGSGPDYINNKDALELAQEAQGNPKGAFSSAQAETDRQTDRQTD